LYEQIWFLERGKLTTQRDCTRWNGTRENESIV